MLVMQTKHGFIIGNKYVFLNFKAQGKEVLFFQSINHSNKKVLIFQSIFFFFILQEMTTKMGQITLVLKHNGMQRFDEKLPFD